MAAGLSWNGLPPFAGGVWVKSTTSVSWVDVAVAVLVAADIKIRYITQVKKSKFNDPNEQLIISMTKISTQDITIMMYSFLMHLLVMITGHSPVQCRAKSGKWFQNIHDLITSELYDTL